MSESLANTSPLARPKSVSKRPLWVGAAMCVLAVILIFGQQTNHQFTNWDDNWLVTENRWIRSFDGEKLSAVLNPWVDRNVREELGNEYLPVRDLSYMANYAAHGYQPAGWHVTDLGLHLAVSLLVLWLTWVLTGVAWSAAAAGVLFAVMPIHVEVVSWVSCRKDLLSTLFGLVSVLMYLRWRGLRAGGADFSREAPGEASAGGRVAWLAISMACFVLALFSKVPVIILPGLLVAIEVFLSARLRPMSMRRAGVAIGGYFALAAFVFLAIAHPIASNGLIREPFGGGWISNTFTALGALQGYFVAMFAGAPIGPVVDAPLRGGFDLASAMGLLVIGTLVAIVGWAALRAVRTRKDGDASRGRLTQEGRLAALGAAWILIALFPVSNLVIVTGTVYADRYAYLPSVGFCLAAAVGLAWLVRRLATKPSWVPGIAVAGFVVFVTWQGARAYSEVPVWQNSLTLWSAALDRDPVNHTALFNRGLVYQSEAAAQRSQVAQELLLEKAEADLRTALVNPTRSYRNDPARVLAAIANLRVERSALAKSMADRRREDGRRDSNEAERLTLLAAGASSRTERDRFEREVADLTAAAEDAERTRLAILAEAEAHLREALVLTTSARGSLELPWRIQRDHDYLSAQLLNIEGLVYDRLGNEAEAERCFRASAEKSSRSPAALLNLAALLGRRASERATTQGHSAEVASLFDEALRTVDEYQNRRGYVDRQALSHRANLLAKKAEAIEGLASREMTVQVKALYEEAASLHAAAAEEVATNPSAAKEWETSRMMVAEMKGRIPGSAQEALEAVTEVASKSAEPLQAELRRAQLLLQTKETAKAIALLSDLAKRYPGEQSVRRELAAVHSAIADARHGRMMTKWTEEYRAATGMTTEKIDHYVVMKRFWGSREFQREFAEVDAAFTIVLSHADPDSPPAKLCAAFLTSVGHTLFELGDGSAAEVRLRNSYLQDPELQLTSELLAAIYFGLMEELFERAKDAVMAGLNAEAEQHRDELWRMMANLVAVSPRASELLAMQFTRKANVMRFPIEEAYTVKQEGGINPQSGQAASKDYVPREKLEAYIAEMRPVIEMYQIARALDPSQPNVLSQLNDYYAKTGEFEKSLEAYAALEARMKDRPRELQTIRTSVASLLTSWAAGEEGKYREALKTEKDDEALRMRNSALGLYLRAAEAWDKAIEAAPSRPDRWLLQSAGGVHQKLAVLEIRAAAKHLARASAVYQRSPTEFQYELSAVLRKRAIHASNDAERLTFLRDALALAAEPEARELIESQIANVEAQSGVVKARAAVDQGRYDEALTLLARESSHSADVRLVRARALDGLQRFLEAAHEYATCHFSSLAQLRAAELFIAENTAVLMGAAHSAATMAERLFTEELMEADLDPEALYAIRSRLRNTEHILQRIHDHSATLLKEARESRSFEKRRQLFRDATTVAPTNYFAHAELADELRLWGQMNAAEGSSLIKNGKREQGHRALREAEGAYAEAAQSWLNALRLDPPFAVQYRLSYLEMLVRDVRPVRQETASLSGLRTEVSLANRALQNALDARATDAPDDPALQRLRKAHTDLMSEWAKVDGD